jgi:hypothetical protein
VDPAPASQAPARRGVNGLLLLLLLVAGGMGITGVYYRWKAAEILAERKAELAAAPTETEPRLERWLQFGRTYIHQRLVQLRVSAAAPWLVTHARLAAGASTPPELWGVDLGDLVPEWVQREGARVVVHLPQAGPLGRAWIPQDKADFVPRLATEAPTPSTQVVAERARQIAEHALQPLIGALAQDIPGAELVVEVGRAPAPQEPPR